MTATVNVLATLDRVARGCALYADRLVGESEAKWSKVALDDYNEARAAVAELIEASRDLLKSGSDEKRNRLRAALAKAQP